MSRAARTGYTLVEMLVVMSAFLVLLPLAARFGTDLYADTARIMHEDARQQQLRRLRSAWRTFWRAHDPARLGDAARADGLTVHVRDGALRMQQGATVLDTMHVPETVRARAARESGLQGEALAVLTVEWDGLRGRTHVMRVVAGPGAAP